MIRCSWGEGGSLTYVAHRHSEDDEDDEELPPQAAVCRCSQPLSGFSGRSPEDEMMLHAVMKANPGSDFIYVVDTRPKVTPTVARARSDLPCTVQT